MKLKFRVKKEDFIIFCVFCVFLFYLICVAVSNVSNFAETSEFSGLNPFPALAPDLIFATILLYIVAFIALLGVPISKLEREKGFGITFGEKEKKPDGYSKWLTEDEVKKLDDVKKITLKDESYEYAGVPLLLNKTEAYVDDGDFHSLVIGSTGSGKTQCIVFPMIRILAKAGESMVIADLKGELYQKSATMLRDLGYQIIILNFREPRRGNAWNPFVLPYQFYNEGHTDKAMELVEDLAANILIDPNNHDNPFWEQSAANYFSGLSIGLFKDAKPEEINLNSINMMASVGDDRVQGGGTFNKYDKEYFLAKGELSNAYVSASTVINAPSETKGGVMSTFRTKTRIFSSREELSEMLSYSDFDFSTIGKQKTAVFMVIHDEKKTYHSLLSIFIKQAYESLVYVAGNSPEGKLPIRTNFILDEFANMPAIKDVDAMFTAARSRNIRMNIFIQSFSQLSQTYGHDMGETIKSNCLNWFFLMAGDLNSLEEISKMCGTQKGKKADKDDPLSGEPDRPLVTVTDLQQMKMFEILVKRSRALPYKFRFATDFELRAENAFDCDYEIYVPEERKPKEIQVFDMKKWVDNYREEQGLNKPKVPPGIGGGMGFGGFGDFGAPNPFAPAETGKKPEDKSNTKIENKDTEKKDDDKKLENLSSPKLDIDDYLKNIDKKVSELKDKTDEKKDEIDKLDFNDNYIKDVKQEKNLENTFISSNGLDFSGNDNDEIESLEIKNENIEENKVIDKPKVNIDVDSIIVDDNITDDQFFDDFFGDDE